MTNSPNLPLAKKLNGIAWVITVVVLALVVLMRRVKIDTSIDFTFLPPVYSTLNAVTAVLLILALLQIKKGNIERHRNFMTVAISTSLLFLLGYVVYHFTTTETLYCGVGGIRTVYFVLLISHVVLAAVIFPFILFTFIRAFTNQIDAHKKMAKWVFPLWLYVAVTGPILYMMLRPCFA